MSNCRVMKGELSEAGGKVFMLDGRVSEAHDTCHKAEQFADI